MKKSKKENLSLEDFIEDMEILLNNIDELNESKISDLTETKLKEIEKNSLDFNKKYKDYLTDNSKEDLDTKE